MGTDGLPAAIGSCPSESCQVGGSALEEENAAAVALMTNGRRTADEDRTREEQRGQMNIRSYRVWDRSTRWFHWINFACIVLLAAIGTAILYDTKLGVTDGGKILLKTTHVLIGYVFVINLAWRFVWAFFGNRYATWPAILPFGKGYGAALKDYARDPRPYVGHNPVARLMISVLFVLLLVQAVTGLILAGTDIYYPPFGRWIAGWVAAPGVDSATIAPYDKTGVDPAAWEEMRAFRAPVLTVHYWTFYALLVLIAAHVTGVIVTELREGGGIISAMFTGRKMFDRQPADDPGEGGGV
jgi:Ni/Fe-hydrogenase 1 B-type cytochrome subunit